MSRALGSVIHVLTFLVDRLALAGLAVAFCSLALPRISTLLWLALALSFDVAGVIYCALITI